MKAFPPHQPYFHATHTRLNSKVDDEMASPFTPAELAAMHEGDSRVTEIHWVYSVPIAASIISTGLRLCAKRRGGNGIHLDDYLIVIATVCAPANLDCVIGELISDDIYQICLLGQCASGLGFGTLPARNCKPGGTNTSKDHPMVWAGMSYMSPTMTR